MARNTKGPEPMTAFNIPTYRTQLVCEGTRRYEVVDDPRWIAHILTEYLNGCDREHLVMMALDMQGHPTGLHTVSVGDLHSAIVSPANVAKFAILANAASVVLAHNHPSGDTTPSPEDIEVTRRISECLDLFQIDLLDHVIVGFTPDEFTSLKRLRHL